MSRCSLVPTTLAVLLATHATAQSPVVPSTIPFQGAVSQQGGGPVSGLVVMTFRIYATPIGGNALWTEKHTTVGVTKGLFKVDLGSITGFPSTLFSGNTLHLGMQVGTDVEMAPHSAMGSRLRIESQ